MTILLTLKRRVSAAAGSSFVRTSAHNARNSSEGTSNSAATSLRNHSITRSGGYVLSRFETPDTPAHTWISSCASVNICAPFVSVPLTKISGAYGSDTGRSLDQKRSKASRREILFPTEPTTIAREKIDRAIERVISRKK
jgi:hypothetical protein